MGGEGWRRERELKGERAGRWEGKVAGEKLPLSEGVCTPGHSPESRPPFEVRLWAQGPGN